MANAEGSDRRSYEVPFDPDAARAVDEAFMLHHWKQWLKAGLSYGFWLLVYTFFLAGLSWLVARDLGNSVGAIVFIVGAFVLGFIIVFYYAYRQLNDFRLGEMGEVWQCEIDSEYWSFQRRNGVKMSIPWRLMKLTFEHPDGWVVEYGSAHLVVYRGPLREAGLEELFKSRIGQDAA